MWNGEAVCYSADIHLEGEHNRANVAAAVALAKCYRAPVSSAVIRQALAKFRAVPDRLEYVREFNGVRYINDTTATTPTATCAALRAMRQPVVLLAGGADKQLDFDELAALVAGQRDKGERWVKAVVLLQGSATPRLIAALAATGVKPAGIYDALEPAVQHAVHIAEAGDVVLLSPACASFGMFVNEFDRGEQFRRIVSALR